MEKHVNSDILLNRCRSIKQNGVIGIIFNALAFAFIVIGVILWIGFGSINPTITGLFVGAYISYAFIIIGSIMGIVALVFNIITAVAAMNMPIDLIQDQQIKYDQANNIKTSGILLLIFSIILGTIVSLIIEAVLISQTKKLTHLLNKKNVVEVRSTSK